MTSVDVELGLTALAAMLSPTTLSFSVFALVLGERPMRTGLWFFFGAFGVTLIIGVVACFQGMNTKGGTEGVGRSATSSVVLSSLFVILADVLLVKLILIFWG